MRTDVSGITTEREAAYTLLRRRLKSREETPKEGELTLTPSPDSRILR
jgi:hypothetical protein